MGLSSPGQPCVSKLPIAADGVTRVAMRGTRSEPRELGAEAPPGTAWPGVSACQTARLTPLSIPQPHPGHTQRDDSAPRL